MIGNCLTKMTTFHLNISHSFFNGFLPNTNHSIAHEMFYKTSFGFVKIGASVRPQIERKQGSVLDASPGDIKTIFTGSRLMYCPNQFGPKRLSIEFFKSYPLMYLPIEFDQNKASYRAEKSNEISMSKHAQIQSQIEKCFNSRIKWNKMKNQSSEHWAIGSSRSAPFWKRPTAQPTVKVRPCTSIPVHVKVNVIVRFVMDRNDL